MKLIIGHKGSLCKCLILEYENEWTFHSCTFSLALFLLLVSLTNFNVNFLYYYIIFYFLYFKENE